MRHCRGPCRTAVSAMASTAAARSARLPASESGSPNSTSFGSGSLTTRNTVRLNPALMQSHSFSARRRRSTSGPGSVSRWEASRSNRSPAWLMP